MPIRGTIPTVNKTNENLDFAQLIQADSRQIPGERVLAHPHDNKQPFTRSLSGIDIPETTQRLLIRARCNLHGYDGRQLLIDLAVPITEDYQIIR